MCTFSANVAFDKATNGLRYIKHEMWEILSLSAIGTLNSSSTILSLVSLLQIVDEKQPTVPNENVHIVFV